MSDATEFNTIWMADHVHRTHHLCEAVWLACHGIADKEESAALCRLVEFLQGEIAVLANHLHEINGGKQP